MIQPSVPVSTAVHALTPGAPPAPSRCRPRLTVFRRRQHVKLWATVQQLPPKDVTYSRPQTRAAHSHPARALMLPEAQAAPAQRMAVGAFL